MSVTCGHVSRPSKPVMAVPGRPARRNAARSASLWSATKVFCSSAGPMPPSPYAPWQAAQLAPTGASPFSASAPAVVWVPR